MIPVSEIRNGMAIRIDGELCKVISFELHGVAKAGRVIHAKLKNLASGVVLERRFRADEKVDDVAVETANMEFLYKDADAYYFMNLSNFEQIAVGHQALGNGAKYIQPNSQLMVELHEGRPINVMFPKILEVKVATTGAGISGQTDSTFKEAVLENGAVVMVPQFIREGDRIKIEIETERYLDRVSQTKHAGERSGGN